MDAGVLDRATGTLAGPPPALDVAGLGHSFGDRRVLDDVAFQVLPGGFTVLLGPNGAGKTTLFALITRLYHATQGRIAAFGQDFRTNPSAALARMGVVFQQPTLDLDLTVEQNLLYHAALHGISRKEAGPRVAAELDRVNLADRARDRVRLLSGGQKRRVELARALVHEPDLLLLDEPTAGLDLESRRFLLQHVRALCADRGLAVLWATHLLDEAGADADVVVLHKGRVLAQGSAAEIAGESSLAEAFQRMTGMGA